MMRPTCPVVSRMLLPKRADDTGNRRWIVFEVADIDSPWEHPIDHDAVYAQAKALLDSGFRYWFQGEEIDELNRRNRRFVRRCKVRWSLL